jgi:hemolysin activation/secretion protein
MIKTKKLYQFLLSCFFMIATATSISAQTIPDAGQTIRELERPNSREPVPMQGVPRLTATPELAFPAAESPDESRFKVNSIVITGATSIPMDELSALVFPWVGREVSFTELRQAAARISQHYQDMGYLLARAYLPEQTPEGGVVTIDVLEGKLSALKLRNSTRINDSRLYGLTEKLTPGKAVKSQAMDRALLLIKELPGVAGVNALLQPGDTVGTTELLVDVLPGPFITGSVEADNYGSTYTGSYRLGSTIYVNSPAGLGDQLSMRVQASNHKLYYGRLAYRIPIGKDGWKIGLAYGASSYHLGRQYTVLDANGSTQGLSMFASYPFVQSQSLVVTGTVSAEQRQLHDRLDSFNVDNSKSTKLLSTTLAASGRRSASSWNAFATYTAGNLDIRTPSSRNLDNISARTHGGFGKLNFYANGQYRLSGPWSVLATVNGQLASKNLDSSEKFSLGGADGVRAYPQGEGVGDEGYLLTTELRYALDPKSLGQIELGAFIDHGAVRINRNPYMEGTNRRQLSAVGVNMLWTMPDNWQLRASVARKLGKEAAQSESDSTARAWLQALKGF